MYSRLNSSSHGCCIQIDCIAPPKSMGFVEPEQNERLKAELELDSEFSGGRRHKAGSHGQGICIVPRLPSRSLSAVKSQTGDSCAFLNGRWCSKKFLSLSQKQNKN